MYSAYLARECFYGCPFLMMNADVFFDSSILKTLLSFEAPNAVVTEYDKYLGESMKVSANGKRLCRIAKTIPRSKALGTSIDVYKFSDEGNKAFFNKCAEYIDIKHDVKLWSEVAINDIFAEVEFEACPINGRWFEIDTLDDLAEAEKIFA